MGFRASGIGQLTGGPQLGVPFFEERRRQAVDVLREAGGVEDPETQAFRRQLQQQLTQRLGGLGALEARRRAAFEAEQQRGLAQALGQTRRQFGGLGLAGSQQFGRGLGEIVAGAQRQRAAGEIGLEESVNRQLAQLQQIQQANALAALRERQQQLAERSALANLLQRQATGEIAREAGSLARQQEFLGGPSGFERLLGTGLAVGGTLAGLPPGVAFAGGRGLFGG